MYKHVNINIDSGNQVLYYIKHYWWEETLKKSGGEDSIKRRIRRFQLNMNIGDVGKPKRASGKYANMVGQ